MPEKKAETQKPQDNSQPVEPNAAQLRLWEDPIVLGDPIPFDPATDGPQLSEEQLKELMDDDED
jgi:hypothetical protein